MLFGKLMLQNPNVLVMDEPTNHLDMESIEALNLALENYEGTLIFDHPPLHLSFRFYRECVCILILT
jgi:ABC-type cobalamin/Fe3+-siderophores transport system ATPase subunit